MVCRRESPRVRGYNAALPRPHLCGPPQGFLRRSQEPQPSSWSLPTAAAATDCCVFGPPEPPSRPGVLGSLDDDTCVLLPQGGRGLPFLIACGSGHPPPPPRGWSARSVSLAHSATGGSTSGKWTLVVWYPPGLPWVEPLTWEPRGGTPLLCCVNDREYARPFLGPRGSGAVGAGGAVVAGVVRTEGLVLDFGLFPASDPSARVIVETSSSPSGYGLRQLTARELGNLWDIPILFLDSLPDPDVGVLMGAICASPPSKLLHTGADLLLTDFFRGGGAGSAMGKGSGEGRAGIVPPGPRPLSDRELGIKRAAPPQDVVSLEKRPRVGVPPQVVQDPEVVTKGPTVPPEDLPRVSTTGEVTKGDSQKADNASVPDHLWLRAFVVGYGDEACAARHREALTLPTGFVGALGTTEPPAGWRGAIPGFRLFALRFWCARTTQGYTAW